ncbi:hypothetical protein BJY59DRAFT_688189 [Rhodotorula toruloides]
MHVLTTLALPTPSTGPPHSSNQLPTTAPSLREQEQVIRSGFILGEHDRGSNLVIERERSEKKALRKQVRRVSKYLVRRRVR